MATSVRNRPTKHCKPLSIEYVMYVYGLCLFYLILRLESYIQRLIFTIQSPNGDLMILSISSPDLPQTDLVSVFTCSSLLPLTSDHVIIHMGGLTVCALCPVSAGLIQSVAIDRLYNNCNFLDSAVIKFLGSHYIVVITRTSAICMSV